jgi:hypothetical protein
LPPPIRWRTDRFSIAMTQLTELPKPIVEKNMSTVIRQAFPRLSDQNDCLITAARSDVGTVSRCLATS